MRFISLHRTDGSPFLLNVRKIIALFPREKSGTRIIVGTGDCTIEVQEGLGYILDKMSASKAR